jgi:hypothetical protein
MSMVCRFLIPTAFLISRMIVFSGYIHIVFSAGVCRTMASFANLSLGVRFINGLEFGITWGINVDNFQRSVIFPQRFSYHQINLGFDLQYRFSKRRISPIVMVNGQIMQSEWRPEEAGENLFSDQAWMLGVGAGGSWAINRLATLEGSFGYVLPQAVDLIGLSNEDYQGWNFEIAIKLGVFSF